MAVLTRHHSTVRWHSLIGESVLLGCGAAYGVVYVVAHDVVAAAMLDHYSRLDQAVSELGARGSPAEGFLHWMLVVLEPLLLAFAVGVWLAVGERVAGRALAVAIALVIVPDVVWLWFPMTAREDMVSGTPAANDIGHIALTVVTVLLIVVQVVVGGWLVRGWFAVYSALTVVAMAVGGAITARRSTELPDPTPWLGLWERVNIGSWLLWMAALGGLLVARRLRRHGPERSPAFR